MTTFIDVHVLQTVPPSNLNRDDAGSPKQAIYGGARRSRVSSQAWKRATRKAFEDQVPRDELGTRTKKISTMLADRLATRSGLDVETATRIATALLGELGIKAGKKATETAYLLFFGRPQLERLVDAVAEDLPRLAALDEATLGAEVKKIPVVKTLGEGHPIDVALFGRMVAELPSLNVDAATQVAHALSTHAVETEFDYYTAVDDENARDDKGAGMIGTVEFSSSTLYRFATIGLTQLQENLGGDATAVEQALRAFLTAFVTSMPTGYQNSFAHRTTPSLVSVVIRDDQPVNLVTAFEQPVRANGHGIAAESAQRLAAELTKTTTLWGLDPAAVASTYSVPDDVAAAKTLAIALGAALAFSDVVDISINAALTSRASV